MDRLIVLQPEELKTLIADAVKSGIDQYKAEFPVRQTLTLAQLCIEWQCSRQAVLNWIKRKDYPLPVHYIGSDPRFHRFEVESWSRSEAKRKALAGRVEI